MRRSGVFLPSALLLLALAGCGVRYGFAGGGLPRDIKTMAVLPFDNQTPSPDVQQELYEHMHRELRKRLGVRDAPQERANAVARGVIQDYQADVPVGFSADPNRAVSARRRVQITIDVEIIDQNSGRVLFQRRGLRGEGEYAERAEAEGRRQAIARLVTEIIEGAQSQW